MGKYYFIFVIWYNNLFFLSECFPSTFLELFFYWLEADCCKSSLTLGGHFTTLYYILLHFTTLTEMWHTLSIPHIRNIYLILSCTHLSTSEKPEFVGTWNLQGVEGVPQGCWPMLTTMLPTVVSSWLYVLWVVDHSWYTRETIERK